MVKVCKNPYSDQVVFFWQRIFYSAGFIGSYRYSRGMAKKGCHGGTDVPTNQNYAG